jgi:hypothetical protein
LHKEVLLARESHRSGHAGRAAHRLRAVLRRSQRAAPSQELEEVVIRAMYGLALADFECSGELDASLELMRSAEARALAAHIDSMVVMVRGQRALMLQRAGKIQESLEASDEAIRILETADPEAQVGILLNRGALLLEQGRLAAAAADLERCAQLASDTGLAVLESKARYNLAYVEFLHGRIPRALAGMDQAEQVNPHDVHPVSLLDRARVLREAGLVRDADGLLGRASNLFGQGRLFQDLAETELVRAECALVEGEAKRARAFAASAHRRFLRRGNIRWQRKAELLILRCDRRTADDKGPTARRTALRGIATRASDLAAACRGEGRADLARAAELLATESRLRAGEAAESVPAIRPTDPLQTRLETHEVRALSAMSEGDNRRAAAEVRKGLAELGSYQNRFGSLDLRTASAVHGGALAKLQLDLAMADGRPSTVFAGVERARAVSTRLAQVRPPSDERTADLLAELRQVEEEARGLAGDAAAAAALAKLRTRATHLQRDIRARAWELEADNDGQMHASARLGPVRDAAGESAFATYARHHGRWVAVVSAGRRVELHDLASVSETDELVRRVRADLDAISMPRLPEPIMVAIRASINTTLRHLDELLVRPLGIDGRPLVVSCSGSLVVMPWSLLPSRFGLPMVVTPSATGWLRSQDAVRPVLPKVVAISGPDLHLSADEAKRVGDVWTSSRVVTGVEATVSVAHEALRAADVVHIAAHGTHRQDSPLFSSIRLADGQLYAYELDTDSHIAPFVALSACEAGLATVRPGDEGLGLTNVLLQLGTRSVLAGVARVRDDGAAEVMQRVHHGMASGMDSAGALAAAQADCVDAGVPVPFLCFGSSW